MFERCIKFFISLNPKNPFFGMVERELLGNIVSAKGVKIDPKGVEAINTIPTHINKKVI